MKTICLTSNAYLGLIPEFCQAHNRHFNENCPVTILGYKSPVGKLPDNFEFVSMGEQPKDKNFTDGPRRYLENFPMIDLVLLLLDDYFIQHVNHNLLAYAWYTMRTNRDVMKFDLSGDVAKREHNVLFRATEHDHFIVMATQYSKYRTSLQAAIWRKEYLMRFLREPMTPWEFEIKGSEMAKMDGAIILGSFVPAIEYRNVMLKGEYQWT